jgi:hypothetical protein
VATVALGLEERGDEVGVGGRIFRSGRKPGERRRESANCGQTAIRGGVEEVHCDELKES